MTSSLITEEMLALSALTSYERRMLADVCRKIPAHGLVVEVGCQLGCSSAIIRESGEYRTIHIDPYRQDVTYLPKWSAMIQQTGRPFTLLCMRTVQAIWHLSRLLQDGVDLAYIDGDHTLAGVRYDLALVVSHVKPGGYFAAHDYGHIEWPGVKQAIDEFTLTGWELVGLHDSLIIWRRL